MLEPYTGSVRLPRMSIVESTRVNPAIVRSYDIRGCVGRQLSLNDARLLGLSYASVARSQRKRHIAVSRDGRLTSPELERALIEALIAGGMQVRRLGLGPTPFMYFAVRAGALDGGIMVTGSHNPPDQNGFKLVLGGEPVCGAALRALVAARPLEVSGGGVSEVMAREKESAQAYVHALGEIGEDVPSSLHVVWDCGNGAVGSVIGPLTAILPGRHTLLNATVDGRFPAHHPAPAVADNLRQLQAAVVREHADLGIAFDGDGDRIGVVDSSGAIIWPDQLLLLLALEALERRRGVPVVADVKSSRVLFEEVTRRGGRAVMAPSGYVRVRAAMLREGAPLAGEMSGHIFFEDCWHATDDALFVALRLLVALGRLGCSLREYRSSLPATAATPELRLHCPEHRKAQVIEEVAARLVGCDDVEVDTTDGLRVTCEDGWWLLRASGTEPKLTARCEAADTVGLDRLQRALRMQLARSGVQCPV